MANEKQLAIDPPSPHRGSLGMRREDKLDWVRDLERQIAQVDAEIEQRVYALSHSATLRG